MKIKKIVGLLLTGLVALNLVGCVENKTEQMVTLEYLGTETIYTVKEQTKITTVEEDDYVYYRLNKDKGLIVKVPIEHGDRLEGASVNYNIFTQSYENVPVTTKDITEGNSHKFNDIKKLKGKINMNGVSQPFKFVDYNTSRKEYKKYADNPKIEKIGLEYLGLALSDSDVERNGTQYVIYLGDSEGIVRTVEVYEYERYSDFITKIGDTEYDVIDTKMNKYILLDGYWYPFKYSKGVKF